MTQAAPTPDEEFFDLPDFTPKPLEKKKKKGFKLYGHVFLCKDRLSFSTIQKFTKALSSKPATGSDGSEDLGELDRVVRTLDWFFKRAIKSSDDYNIWVKMRDDDDLEVDVEVLLGISTYLSEAYASGRPTGESSDSGRKTSSSADGSRGGAPSAPSTYTRSETPQLVTASSKPSSSS